MKNLAYYLTAVVICVFVVFMYSVFFERPWLVYKNVPFPPVAHKIHAGDVIPLHVERCNSSAVRRVYRFSHALVSNDRPRELPLTLPESMGFVAPGCQEFDSDANTIPLGTTPGTYHIIGLSEINMTVGTVLVEWYSQTFEVIK